MRIEIFLYHALYSPAAKKNSVGLVPIDILFKIHAVSGAIWGGSRVAVATPDQAVATPEFFGPMRRGGQEL